MRYSKISIYVLISFIVLLILNFIMIHYFFEKKEKAEYNEHYYIDYNAENLFKKYFYSELKTSLIPDSCFTIPVETNNENSERFSNFTYFVSRNHYEDFSPIGNFRYYDCYRHINCNNQRDLLIEQIYKKYLVTVIIRKSLNKGIVILSHSSDIKSSVVSEEYHKYLGLSNKDTIIRTKIPICSTPSDEIQSSADSNVLKYIVPVFSNKSYRKININKIISNYDRYKDSKFDENEFEKVNKNYIKIENSSFDNIIYIIGNIKLKTSNLTGCIRDIKSIPKQ